MCPCQKYSVPLKSNILSVLLSPTVLTPLLFLSFSPAFLLFFFSSSLPSGPLLPLLSSLHFPLLLLPQIKFQLYISIHKFLSFSLSSHSLFFSLALFLLSPPHFLLSKDCPLCQCWRVGV